MTEASGFLVGPAVFKTVRGGASSLAGSIPVRLRHAEKCPQVSAISSDAASLTGSHATLVRMSSQERLTRVKRLAEQADIAVDELLEFLDSPAGRRLRKVLAGAVIVSVPLIMRIPGLKRSPIGRLVAVTGGGAILVGIAEAIRDWERSDGSGHHGPVVEVPPDPAR